MNLGEIDWSRADLVVSEYVARLSDENQIAGNVGRTWLEFCMQRNGLIRDVRSLSLGQTHAIWYSALLKTKRLREVNSLEKRVLRLPKGVRTTQKTITACRNGRLRDTVVARMLREMNPNF